MPVVPRRLARRRRRAARPAGGRAARAACPTRSSRRPGGRRRRSRRHRPAAMKPAAALSSTTSRRGPGAPARTPSTRAAFSAGRAAGQLGRRDAGQPELREGRRVDRRNADAGRPDVVDDAGAVEGQLVDARAVDDDRPILAEQPEDLGDLGRGRRIPDADDEPVHAGRVRQRAQEVERRPDADLEPGRPGEAHRRTEGRREQEGEAVGPEGLGRREVVVVGPHAQRLEDVGRAGARGDRPVAVLGDRNAGRGHDEGRRRRDVERPAPVAAGPDDVDRPGRGDHPEHPGAHRPGEAGQLGRRLAAHPQGDEERRQLGLASPRRPSPSPSPRWPRRSSGSGRRRSAARAARTTSLIGPARPGRRACRFGRARPCRRSRSCR